LEERIIVERVKDKYDARRKEQARRRKKTRQVENKIFKGDDNNMIIEDV
jgi:hypothetical protein